MLPASRSFGRNDFEIGLPISETAIQLAIAGKNISQLDYNYRSDSRSLKSRADFTFAAAGSARARNGLKMESARMFEGKPPKAASRTAERRTAKRHMSVFLLAKITAGDRQSLGRVLNLSHSGAKIETRLAFTPGDPLFLEIRSDLKVAGTVRWVGDKSIGILFDKEIDVGRFLSREQPKLRKEKPRAPRYVCDTDASISAETEKSVLKVRDVSLSGAGLTGETTLNPGEDVLVTILGLEPRRAKVMWSNAQGIGITFLKPLDFRDFDQWLDEQKARPQEPR